MSSRDRELLELAAKAAGLDGVWQLDGHDAFYVGPKYNPNEGVRYRVWNPLTDDGDALRLAVKLNLDILQDEASARSNSVEVVANLYGVETQPWAWEVRAPDPYAATRRAIVRAAAEIAKQEGTT